MRNFRINEATSPEAMISIVPIAMTIMISKPVKVSIDLLYTMPNGVTHIITFVSTVLTVFSSDSES